MSDEPENKEPSGDGGDEKLRIQYRKLDNTLTTKSALIVLAVGAVIFTAVMIFQLFFNDTLNNGSNAGSDTGNENGSAEEEEEENGGDENVNGGNDENNVSEESGDFVIETRDTTGQSPDVVYNGGGPEALPIINVREGALHYYNAGSSSCPPTVERVEEESLDSYVLHIADYGGMACTMDYVPVQQTITHADESREFVDDVDVRLSVPSLAKDNRDYLLPDPNVESSDESDEADTPDVHFENQ